MAKELSIDVPDLPEEATLSIDVPEPPKKRVSNPIKQGVASVVDLVTEIPGVLGLGGAGLQAGYNYLFDNKDKGFGKHFEEAMTTGTLDTSLIDASETLRQGTNKLLGIKDPVSTEDQIARNLALFLPIPAPSKFSKLGKFGAGATNIILPTVKRGTKASMLTRGGLQGGFGVGIDQGVRAVIDSDQAPLMFSEKALSGGTSPDDPMTTPPEFPESSNFGSGLTIDVPTLTIDVPTPEITETTLSINVPETDAQEYVHNELDTDARMEKERDWDGVKGVALALGAMLGGGYLVRKHVKPFSELPKPDPNFSSGKYAQEQYIDRGKVADHVFEEMGESDRIREGADNMVHTDTVGLAKEAVTEGKYGQGFDNTKFPSHSEAILETDEAVLRQSGRSDLFNNGMKAQSELAAMRDKRDPSLWRQGTTDAELQKQVDAARADPEVDALMNKHAQNYRADLEYEVHRGFSTRNDVDEILKVFGDITVDIRAGTYMPFYNRTEQGLFKDMARRYLGINTKKGDELQTLTDMAKFQARGGGTVENILNPGQAIKRHRFHNASHVNEQLYRHSILSNMSGFSVKSGNVVRRVAGKALDHSKTGRGTHLVAVSDEIKLADDPNAIAMKIVKDDDALMRKDPSLKDMSINDLRQRYGKELETVQHQGKLYAYRVPDAGIRGAINLNPKLGRMLEFNNHWKNVFTTFTTGNWSLFAPISHAFSAQTVASTTVATARKQAAAQGKKMGYLGAVKEGFKSYGRSLGASRDIFMDQSAGILANYLARSIATQTGLGKNAIELQKTLHNRYSNSFLSLVRGETGRTRTGIGSVDESILQMQDGLFKAYGKEFSDYFALREMGALKQVFRAFNMAANEGPAFGVVQREIGKYVQMGKIPSAENIAAIRSAVEAGKTAAGDMARRGASPFVQGVQATIPFSSAMIQSWNALGSAAKYDWKAFTVGAGALIGAPTLMELSMNAAMSKTGMTFEDATGKEWTYDDYYWNGFTTQQRNDNMLLFLPGKPPWEALVIPISPEWGLFRSVVMEGADAVFNLSNTGNIKEATNDSEQQRLKVGRDHFLESLHRVFDIPVPPVLAAIGSGFGVDLRAGLSVEEGGDPSDPSSSVKFLRGIPIGTGERITGRMGRTKDVNGFHDKNTNAIIKDLFGAGGTAYVAFADALAAGTTNVDGNLAKGLGEGLGSILDSARRQARYLQPLPLIGGKIFKPSAFDEIGTSLHGKREALTSLTKDMKVLMGGQQSIEVDGKYVDVNTIIPTQDPIRQDMAMEAKIVLKNITLFDQRIATLRGEISKLALTTSMSRRERQDLIDGKTSEISAYKSQQLGIANAWEVDISKMLSDKYKRNINVDLGGGLGKTAGARPNLDSSGKAIPNSRQTSE